MSRALLVSTSAVVLLWSGLACSQPLASAAPAPGLERPPVSLTLNEMASIHAGSDTTVDVLTRQQLSGTTSGNTIVAGTLTSGAVAFSPQALSGFNGVGNFVINTGANNTLQGAINISVVAVPPAP